MSVEILYALNAISGFWVSTGDSVYPVDDWPVDVSIPGGLIIDVVDDTCARAA